MSVKVLGIEALKTNLQKLEKAVNNGLDEYMSAKAIDVERDAKINAQPHVDTGFLWNNIYANIDEKLYKTVVSGALYSAYVEFGTGKKVQVPAGLEEYAIQFKGAGIKEVNLPARPFLFPAFFKHLRPEIVEKDLKKMIEG